MADREGVMEPRNSQARRPDHIQYINIIHKTPLSFKRGWGGGGSPSTQPKFLSKRDVQVDVSEKASHRAFFGPAIDLLHDAGTDKHEESLCCPPNGSRTGRTALDSRQKYSN